LLADPRQLINVQLAINHAADEDNCMWVIPASHLMSSDQLKEENGVNKTEVVAGTGDAAYRWKARETAFQRIVLRQGECFFFHSRLLHASSVVQKPSQASTRIALALRVCTPEAFSPAASRERERCIALLGHA
jgi:ectoine hydroxylase-related dioxygenase (phytanoyl-CoA dioxygenase family)